jgi:pimeloyl-ACP methyl ester carboxylesterase
MNLNRQQRSIARISKIFYNLNVTFFLAAALLVMISPLLSSCSLLGLRPQLKEVDQLVYYTGQVAREKPGRGAIIVVLYAEQKGKADIIVYDVIPKEGTYHLIAGSHPNHKILAFEDANGNFIYDAGERLGYLRRLPLNAGKERKPETRGDILVTANEKALPSFPLDLSHSSAAEAVQRRSSRVGGIIKIDDPLFDAEKGMSGFYKPYDFLWKLGPALYMLEPYDPQREPVILVHGAQGTPADFRFIAEHFDKKRFQIWVYFWPTGLPVDFSAWFFEQALEEMELRYGCKQLNIIAHSMGGLMSRAAINMRTRQNRPPLLNRFITISTPWRGHVAAELGVKQSPVVVPSWEDMAPRSSFLNRLFAVPLPSTTRHALLFSHRGSNLFTSGNDDGSVSIGSMLAYEAQDQAFYIYGYDEDHVSILSSMKLLDTLHLLLK